MKNIYKKLKSKYKLFFSNNQYKFSKFKLPKIIIYPVYFLIYFFSFIEAVLSMFFLSKRRSASLPFFKAMDRVFKFTPLLLYKYKPNASYHSPVPAPVYNTDGSIKDIFWDGAGLQKIDNFGRPIVSVEQSKSVFEGENSKERWEDKSKKIAVAITGGSTVAGSGCRTNHESLPSRLQEVLGNSFEVHNFGAGGYSTFDELVYMWTQDVQAQVIVHYTGWNTLAYSSIFTGTNIDSTESVNFFPTNEVHQELQLFIKQYIPLGFIGIDRRGLHKLVSSSFIYRLFYPIFKIFLGDAIQKESIRAYRPQKFLSASQAAESAFRALVASYSLAKTYKVKFLVVLQPTIVQKKKLHPVEEFLYNNPISTWRSNGQQSLTLIKDYYQELSNMLKNSTIPYVDLSNIFADNENWIFNDEVHINTQGNFEIAKSLAPKIKQLFK